MQSEPGQTPFFEQRFIPSLWALRHGKEGCTIENEEEFQLGTECAAPPLLHPPPVVERAPATLPPGPPPSKPAPRERQSFAETVVDFFEWLEKPARPPKPADDAVAKRRRVKPFDIQDIPGAMDKIGWPMSAKILRRWFSGKMNYATSDEGARVGIDHDGEPFSQSMIETKMLTLDWVLGFPRAKAKYEALLGGLLFNESARQSLRKILSRRQSSLEYVDAWELCGGDFQKYHQQFQYQRNPVDSENTEKFLMFLKGAAMPHGLLMDDLYGALGAFSFYAALHRFSLHRVGLNRGRAVIGEIAVYIRDVFTFHDRSGSPSQYLGHWNKKGFVIVPAATAWGEMSHGDWLMYPIARHGKISEDTVYYPVRNKDYRAWQLKHAQGGDMILYSDRKIVRLVEPQVIEFDL